jgi:hypothetical protein
MQFPDEWIMDEYPEDADDICCCEEVREEVEDHE